MDLGLTSQP